jgi:hypothetical protein
VVLSFAVARVRAPGLMEPGLFLQPAPMEDVNALVERFLSGAWPRCLEARVLRRDRTGRRRRAALVAQRSNRAA